MDFLKVVDFFKGKDRKKEEKVPSPSPTHLTPNRDTIGLVNDSY